MKTIPGHRWTVECLLLQRTEALGEVVVSGSWDGQVQVTRLCDNTCAHTFVAHTACVACVAATPRHLASGGTDGLLVICEFSWVTPHYALDHGQPIVQVRAAWVHGRTQG
jgi:WD40 repeat protein